MIEFDRLPPQSLEAERALLGSILVDASIMPHVAPIVRPSDFYAHVHGTVYLALAAIYERNDPIDKVSLAEELQKRDKLENVGGLSYLSLLMQACQSVSSAEYYAKIVAEKAALRSLITVGTAVVSIGFDGEDDVPEALSEAERLIFAVRDRQALPQGASLSSLLRPMYDEISGDAEKPPVFLTPYPTLNKSTGGFGAGELVTIGASPAMGKTGFAIGLADYTAAMYGHTVLAALEMGTRPTVLRLNSMYSGITVRELRAGTVKDRQWDRLSDGMAKLAKRNLTIIDKYPRIGISELRTMCRKLHRQSPLKSIIVDHAGFLKDVYAPSKESKHERLSNALMGLLDMASEFSCPVYSVYHMNREAQDKEPNIFMLRDGGNVEGHSTSIIFPWRPNPMGTPEEQRVGKIIIGKCREGQIGEVPMTFRGERSLWLEQGQAPWFEAEKAG